MITFNGIDLFSSGPSQLKPGPIQSRDALAQTPGAIGASLVSQGLAPREIAQQGTLIADNEPALHVLIKAIESHIGIDAAMLVDINQNEYPGCVMRQFDIGLVERLGPRYACDYTVTYLQTTP